VYPDKIIALVFECICKGTVKFHEKILFDSGVIKKIPMTKYLRVSDTATCLAASFQQDNAPAHRARETVQLLTCETRDFIAPALWPANSPDMNLVNYQTWGKHRSRMHDVDQLKSRMIEEWEFHQVFIDEAIRQWRPRLGACIRAHEGHLGCV